MLEKNLNLNISKINMTNPCKQITLNTQKREVYENNSLHDNLSSSQVWEFVSHKIRTKVCNGVYKEIISKIEFGGIVDNTAFIYTQTNFTRDIILNNYIKYIREAFFELDSVITKVNVMVMNDDLSCINTITDRAKSTHNSRYSSLSGLRQTKTPRFINGQLQMLDQTVHNCKSLLSSAEQNSSIEQCSNYPDHQDQQCPIIADSHTFLHKGFTFDNFIYDPSNKLAYFATRQVVDMIECDAKNVTCYVSSLGALYIHSDVGMGKTHLVQALVSHIASNFPNIKAAYFTAERFMNVYVQHVRSNRYTEFKNFLSLLDVMVIDDLQLMSGKSGTEREFVAAFDHLLNRKKTVIVCSNILPQNLNLDARTKSRLSSCFVAQIENPGIIIKIRILKQQLTSLQHQTSSAINITEEMLETIASNVNVSIREMNAALQRFVLYCDIAGVEPTNDVLHQMLMGSLAQSELDIGIQSIDSYVSKSHNSQSYNSQLQKNKRKSGKNLVQCKNSKSDAQQFCKKESECFNDSNNNCNDQRDRQRDSHRDKSIPFDNILSVVAQYTKCNVDDILSKKKDRQSMYARKIIVMLAKTITNMTYKEIGMVMGGRSHSTIMHLENVAQRDVVMYDVAQCKEIIYAKLS